MRREKERQRERTDEFRENKSPAAQPLCVDILKLPQFTRPTTSAPHAAPRCYNRETNCCRTERHNKQPFIILGQQKNLAQGRSAHLCPVMSGSQSGTPKCSESQDAVPSHLGVAGSCRVSSHVVTPLRHGNWVPRAVSR